MRPGLRRWRRLTLVWPCPLLEDGAQKGEERREREEVRREDPPVPRMEREATRRAHNVAEGHDDADAKRDDVEEKDAPRGGEQAVPPSKLDVRLGAAREEVGPIGVEEEPPPLRGQHLDDLGLSARPELFEAATLPKRLRGAGVRA